MPKHYQNSQFPVGQFHQIFSLFKSQPLALATLHTKFGK